MSNTLISKQTFGDCLRSAKAGLSFRLPKWEKDVLISMQIPEAHSKMTHPYLYVSSRFGCVPWIPTMVEMLSEEWDIVSKTVKEVVNETV
jgi:hypothetical protein